MKSRLSSNSGPSFRVRRSKWFSIQMKHETCFLFSYKKVNVNEPKLRMSQCHCLLSLMKLPVILCYQEQYFNNTSIRTEGERSSQEELITNNIISVEKYHSCI